MNIRRFCMHWNQQAILSLLFYQASHEGRIYALPKLQKSRRGLSTFRRQIHDIDASLVLNVIERSFYKVTVHDPRFDTPI